MVAETTQAAVRSPATADVEALLARMRSAYQSIASADMRYAIKEPGRQIHGALKYRPPSSVDATLDVWDYGTVRVTSDGTTVRVEDPTQPKTEETPWTLQSLRRAIGANLEVINLWDSQRQLSTGDGGNMRGEDLSIAPRERWNGRDWIILEEKAGQTTFRYFIHPTTAMMWRTVAVRRDGSVVYDATIDRLKLTSAGSSRR
jgi:hypothetical protein